MLSFWLSIKFSSRPCAILKPGNIRGYSYLIFIIKNSVRRQLWDEAYITFMNQTIFDCLHWIIWFRPDLQLVCLDRLSATFLLGSDNSFDVSFTLAFRLFSFQYHLVYLSLAVKTPVHQEFRLSPCTCSKISVNYYPARWEITIEGQNFIQFQSNQNFTCHNRRSSIQSTDVALYRILLHICSKSNSCPSGSNMWAQCKLA